MGGDTVSIEGLRERENKWRILDYFVFMASTDHFWKNSSL
jgi:hypothetical protein